MLAISTKGETILLKEQVSKFLVHGDDITTKTLVDSILHFLNHNLSFRQRDMIYLYQRLLQQMLYYDVAFSLT